MLEKDLKSLINILEESNINELEVSTFWGKQNSSFSLVYMGRKTTP